MLQLHMFRSINPDVSLTHFYLASRFFPYVYVMKDTGLIQVRKPSKGILQNRLQDFEIRKTFWLYSGAQVVPHRPPRRPEHRYLSI